MNKQDIVDFFDRLAPDWDAHLVRDDAKIGAILDYAGIQKGVCVLDVACGTGVLIPDYLARGVQKVVGVDLSRAMIAAARAKHSDPRAEFLHGDIETIDLAQAFDRCVVYNALPHFPSPQNLIRALADKLLSGGRLTIAHGMSREAINARHSGEASKVSMGLIGEDELAGLFAPHFDVDIAMANEEMYVVSGTKKEGDR